MKRRTLLIFVVILSLLLIPVPANASSVVTGRASDAQESAQRSEMLSRDLADIFNTLPEGHHDNFAGIISPFFCRAEGWAADPDDRAAHLNIRIFSDGVEIAQTVADTFRPDLADAGVCQDGNCSFSLSLWSLITPDVDHLILVQGQDAQTGEWATLYDTPKTLNCFTAQAQTLVVNSTSDNADANPGDSVCETFTPGECTLRAAIHESNANPGTDTINFNIPGEGSHTINPSYGFDFIVDPVIIDARTQPGFAGVPLIELNGSNAGPDAFGLVIFAGSSVVRGLVINRFALTGLDIDVNGGNIIQGNYIGTDLTGTVNLGNGVNGVAISQGSSGNLIGGTIAGTGNLISGNGEFGIVIVDTGSNGNLLQGNLIGTDVTGTADLGNASVGVLIGAGASDNLIGGTDAGARNLISGNDSAGVHFDTASSTGNRVEGNYIGTDVTGTLALGNVFEGVFVGSGTSHNVIGGTVSGAGNLISGNFGNGVTIADDGASENSVQGNFIGTDVTGKLALGNAGHGILIGAGVRDNRIGGTSAAAANVIAFNNAHGIVLTFDAGAGNMISSNSIHTNSSLGIDLGDTGVTSNDSTDEDNGPNNLQNFPVLTEVKSKNKGIEVQGTFMGAPTSSFRLEFFNNNACDPSGYGEGQTYLGFAQVRTNTIGRASFKVTLQTSPPNTDFVTATATDPSNNTSEFSPCMQVKR
jgi:CSLREA domain-containing protein